MSEPSIDLGRPQHVHLIAIGGKAMSTMAEVLLAMGHRVTGSHDHDDPELDRLRALGAEVFVGHAADQVDGADVVARSTAVPADNVERREALRRGIPVLGRPELQGAIAHARRAVAVSGTHGKTSTTAMLATIVTHAGLDASYMVGGRIGGGLGSARWGSGEWLVVEADESDGTFLMLGAEVAVVTNVDADHLDQWGSLDAIEAGFDRFLAEASGPTVVGADNPVSARLGARHDSITYGTAEGASWQIVDVVLQRQSTSFALIQHGVDVGRFELPEPGLHNARNAAAAVVAAHCIGVPVDVSRDALAGYPGLERRFEVKGEVGGITVVDDYAHNPAKVGAVLAAASAGGWGRVVAVFQPHRYSRTADLWRDFADSFVDADLVVVTELDPSGETARPGVSGRLIVDAVIEAHPETPLEWVPDRSSILPLLVDLLVPGDLCITIGAGDVTELGEPLLNALRERLG
jgi:UDP-N-acetylmuramate--alanine ligase